MPLRRKRHLALLAAILFLSSPAFATPGAWTQAAGKGIFIQNAFLYATDHYFDRDGDRQSQPEFRKYELNPYVEYGLTDAWTIGGSAFLDALVQEDGAGGKDKNYGLGNSQLFARWQAWRGESAALSLEPMLLLPATYRDDGQPQSGYGNFGAGGYVNLGYAPRLIGEGDYSELRAGYRHRFGELKDQWQIEAKYGAAVAPRWTIAPEISYTAPVGGIDMGRRSVAGDNDYRLTKLQLSAIYDLDEIWSLQGGGFYHVAGKNTGQGGGGLLSLWRRF